MTAKKILVADDDRNFLKIIQDALVPRGYNVVTAANGQHALQVFQTERPDVILLDALLPIRDGFEVCEAVRSTEYGSKVPIVMMTAVYKMPDKEREARVKYKVKDYLTKPIDLKYLLKVIEQLTVA